MKIITPDQIASIQQMRSEGHGSRSISKALSISRSTVVYWLDPKEFNRKAIERRRRRFNRSPLLGKMRTYKDRKSLVVKARDFQRRISGRTMTSKTSVESFSLDNVLEKIGPTPKCYLTGSPIDIGRPETYSFDHVVPASKGGDNSLANLGLLRADINLIKSDKTVEELIGVAIEVLTHMGYAVTKQKLVEGNGAGP